MKLKTERVLKTLQMLLMILLGTILFVNMKNKAGAELMANLSFLGLVLVCFVWFAYRQIAICLGNADQKQNLMTRFVKLGPALVGVEVLRFEDLMLMINWWIWLNHNHGLFVILIPKHFSAV